MCKPNLQGARLSQMRRGDGDGFIRSLLESNMTPHEAGEETENYLLHFEALARTASVWVC